MNFDFLADNRRQYNETVRRERELTNGDFRTLQIKNARERMAETRYRNEQIWDARDKQYVKDAIKTPSVGR